MSVLVAYSPEGSSRAALELGRMLATSSRLPLVVCCVVSNRWEVPTPDVEYARHLRSVAEDALAEAREIMGAGVEAEYVVLTGRSVPGTLVGESVGRGAQVLVVGSPGQASWGHVALGSVTDRLMHSSEVTLALAPRGFRSAPGARVRRVTVALDGTPNCSQVLVEAARVAATVDAKVRVVTFGVRGRTMYPPEIGLRVEDDVLAAWRDQAAAALDVSVAELRRVTAIEPDEVLVAVGRSWMDAVDDLDWDDGDVLVIGSSMQGPFSRVFLGATATRIVRSSPVPVAVVPRPG